MSKTHSMRPRYLVAALLGVAAGGLIVAVTTRAFPKMMSGMCKKMMHKMMTEMKEPRCGAEDLCKQMMASMEQTTEHPTCES